MNSNAVVIAEFSRRHPFLERRARRKAFGYSAAEAVGKTLDFIVPAEYREAHWKGSGAPWPRARPR